MNKQILPFDPYNIIITGVGGQGNVLASRVVGNMLSHKGLNVTIGETFGASQRGGSVMSHLRVSSESNWSPQIPKGKCHLVISLEPTEAIRVLTDYGNQDINVFCNTRPVHSISVLSGESDYPSMDEIKFWVGKLSNASWFIDATEKALEIGNPIFGNIIMVGAAIGTGLLPLNRDDFKSAISETMTADKVALNLQAFDVGAALVK